MRKWLIALLFMSACSGKSTTAPTPVSAPPPPPPLIPACQANNTGMVRFENRFQSTTLDVVWDGAKIATLTPGQTSSPFTFAAGVAHTLRFQVTNSSVPACAQGAPVLTQCGNQTYWCPA